METWWRNWLWLKDKKGNSDDGEGEEEGAKMEQKEKGVDKKRKGWNEWRPYDKSVVTWRDKTEREEGRRQVGKNWWLAVETSSVLQRSLTERIHFYFNQQLSTQTVQQLAFHSCIMPCVLHIWTREFIWGRATQSFIISRSLYLNGNTVIIDLLMECVVFIPKWHLSCYHRVHK